MEWHTVESPMRLCLTGHQVYTYPVSDDWALSVYTSCVSTEFERRASF